MSFTQTFTMSFLVLMIVALVVSCIGFYKYVYFISLGYGFSIAVMGTAMPILFRENPEYQEYVKKTPILLPLIPLYSVAKYKWLVG